MDRGAGDRRWAGLVCSFKMSVGLLMLIVGGSLSGVSRICWIVVKPFEFFFRDYALETTSNSRPTNSVAMAGNGPVNSGEFRTRNLVGLLLKSGPARLFSALGTMVLGVVLARTLSKPDFGMYSFCLFVLVALSMLSRYGLESVLLRYGGSAWHQKDRVRFGAYGAWALEMTTKNAILITLLAVLLLGVFDFSQYFDPELMLWTLVSLLPWSLLYSISAIFKSAHRVAMGCLLEVGVVNHIAWVTVLVFKVCGMEISAVRVAIVLLCAAIFVCGVGLLLLKRNNLWPRKDASIAHQKAEFQQACRAIVIVVIMHLMASNGGLFFLGLFWNASEVAVFSAPARLAQATLLFTNLVTLIISPRLSGRYESGDQQGFQQVLRKGCLIVFAINFPVLILISIGSPWIMQLMGSTYVPYWPILSIMAIGQAVNIVAGLAPTVLCMTGMEKLWSRLSFYNASVGILVTVALSYYFGAFGAAIGASTYQATQSWLAAVTVKLQRGYWTIPPLRWSGLKQWRQR